MLLQSIPQGPEAICFQNTLFRVSELCWIKAFRLSSIELALRIAAALSAGLWILLMAKAKGSPANIEFLLFVFPALLAWTISGSSKVGSTGDFEESYEGRSGLQSSVFRGWIEAVKQRDPEWLHLSSSTYDLLINPRKVAWARPCFQWQLLPLIVTLAFSAYIFLLGLGLDDKFKDYPVIKEFQILIFHDGATSIKLLSYFIIVLSLVALALSFKRSVEICAAGGIQDTFALTAQDQATLLRVIASGLNSSDRAANLKKTTSAAVPPAPTNSSVLVVEATPAKGASPE